MFKINLALHSGFNAAQEAFLSTALKKLELVMNSSDLKDQITNFSSPLGNRFEDNEGLSNEQVFEKLYTGNEIYDPLTDFEADLYLYLVRKRKPLLSKHPAIGYGLPGQKEIYTYTWWFNRANDYEYAAHIAHEWSHKVGFKHSFKPTPTRDFSVPYAFGNIIESLCKKINL